MADNKTAADASGVPFTFATDQVGGVDFVRAKQVFSDDSVAPVDVSSVNPLPVTGKFGGFADNPSQSITRPNDALGYNDGDLIANSITGSAVAYPQLTVARTASGSFQMERMRVATNNIGSIANCAVRARLWAVAAPVYNGGDNSPYTVSLSAPGSVYLGSYIGVWETFNDKSTAILTAEYGRACIKLSAGQNIWWDLQAVTGFTPLALAFFALTAEVQQD